MVDGFKSASSRHQFLFLKWSNLWPALKSKPLLWVLSHAMVEVLLCFRLLKTRLTRASIWSHGIITTGKKTKAKKVFFFFIVNLLSFSYLMSAGGKKRKDYPFCTSSNMCVKITSRQLFFFTPNLLQQRIPSHNTTGIECMKKKLRFLRRSTTEFKYASDHIFFQQKNI